MTVLSTDPCAGPFAAVGPLAPIVGREVQVPLVQGGSVRYANLDYAASAPALQSVADAITELLPLYSSVHRGAGYLSQVCTSVYESARTQVAAFVGARTDDVVLFTRNTTDSLNLLATAVPGETVHLDIEHHANLLPWQRTRGRVVVAANTVAETLQRLDIALTQRPAALLSVTGASNVTGECLPLTEIADLAHRHGARLAVDGAQLLPHRRVDISTLGIDYLAFSGHKLYAPFGAGVLIGQRDWLDAAPPYLAGGGAVRNVKLDGTQWADSPARHEAGTPNVLGAAAIAAACRTLSELDDDAWRQHEATLSHRLEQGLQALGIQPLRLWSDGDDAVGLAAFNVAGYPASHTAAFLSAEHGIGVRDGRFCAHPLLVRFGGDAAVRASVGLGSSSDDVDRLLDALTALRQHGPRWTYVETDAGYVPSPETRRMPLGLALEKLPL
jgi:selenocysteine lyase/cysteine desulfurase